MGRTDEVQFMQECIAEWRRLGARVTLEPGWESRGNGSQANYEGGIVHHTASNSSAANPNPTRGILVNGRPDLSGPLCNVTGPWCADGDPWLHVIAAYPANHAGASGGKSMGPLPVTGSFNTRVVGLEIDYSGTAPMTAGQRKAALIFTRGLTNVLKVSTEYVRAHAETSVTGKWDPGYASGKTIDMAAFRRDAAAITAPAASTPAPVIPLETNMKVVTAPGRTAALVGPGVWWEGLNAEQAEAQALVWGKVALGTRQWDVARQVALDSGVLKTYGQRIDNLQAQVTAIGASLQAVADAVKAGGGLTPAQAVAAGQEGAKAALAELGKELSN